MISGVAYKFKPTSINLGILSCWVAVLIYAASNSVVTMLVNIGDANRIDGINVITFANLLVLGSAISLIPMGIFFWRDWKSRLIPPYSRGCAEAA